MKRYVLLVGGTGARLADALIVAASAGVFPAEKLHVLLADTDRRGVQGASLVTAKMADYARIYQAMETNVKFRDEANRLLAQAEKDAITPLQKRIDETLRLIAAEHSYLLIVNTDSNTCPFISPIIGDDINVIITEALKK